MQFNSFGLNKNISDFIRWLLLHTLQVYGPTQWDKSKTCTYFGKQYIFSVLIGNTWTNPSKITVAETRAGLFFSLRSQLSSNQWLTIAHSRIQTAGVQMGGRVPDLNTLDFGGGWGRGEVVCRYSWCLRTGNVARTSAAKMTVKCELKGDSVIGQDPHMWLKQCWARYRKALDGTQSVCVCARARAIILALA